LALHYDGSKIWSVGSNMMDDRGSTAAATNGYPLDVVWDFTVMPRND
jgi:hypothetical protein